eukprot:s3049_g1.t1
MLAVAAQRALAHSLLELPLAGADECDGAEPPSGDLLADARDLLADARDAEAVPEAPPPPAPPPPGGQQAAFIAPGTMPPPNAGGLAGLLAGNPLLAANPLLTANPLILATLANPAQPSAAIQQAGPTAAEEVDSNLIDPDTNSEERHARRLSDIMKNRQETFVEDMERLYDVLERANSPAGLLVVKMREMEEGTFVGKDLAAVSKKYKLDEQAESKLADILARYDDARRKECPNATAFMRIATSIPLAQSPRSLVKGSPWASLGSLRPEVIWTTLSVLRVGKLPGEARAV